MTRHSLRLLAAAALALAAGAASAQHSFYLGGAYIDVHSKSDPLSFSPAKELPSPAEIEVDDASTVGFGYAYRFTPRWSVEFALGIPPKHKTYGRGSLEPFGQVSTVKQVAPTVFANYHFGPYGRVEPFVGAGINYTRFTDARSTAAGNAASQGPTEIDLSDSVGAAVHAGVSFAIDKNWSVISTIAYADVKSDLTATTRLADGSTRTATTRIKFNPVVYTLCIGYTF